MMRADGACAGGLVLGGCAAFGRYVHVAGVVDAYAAGGNPAEHARVQLVLNLVNVRFERLKRVVLGNAHRFLRHGSSAGCRFSTRFGNAFSMTGVTLRM